MSVPWPTAQRCREMPKQLGTPHLPLAAQPALFWLGHGTVRVAAPQVPPNNEGYFMQHGGKLVTVFSASNYCGLTGNTGAVLVVRAGGACEVGSDAAADPSRGLSAVPSGVSPRSDPRSEAALTGWIWRSPHSTGIIVGGD